jgi:hypothetical protein
MAKSEMAISRELWTSNLVDAAEAIGDTEHQCRRWLAPNAFAWERPEELINTICDDCLLELFIEEYGAALPRLQAEAAIALRDELSRYCEATPRNLDPEQVLADPRWEVVRSKARAFVAAFASWSSE